MSFVATALGERLRARPNPLTIGLQLGTVSDHLQKDFEGTLNKVAAIGYREVENSFREWPIDRVRAALRDNGLKSPSGVHGASRLYSDLQSEIDRALGIEQQYIVCAVPQPRHSSTPVPASKEEKTQYFRQLSLSLTLDDYKWNADKFNDVGEACRRAGLQFCFHNEGFDFRKTGKVVHYDELVRLTDKNLVRLEMDCYWVARAGHDVIGYIDKYANRIEMLHMADLALGTAPSTDIENGTEAEIPLGTGFIDWAAVLSRTRQAGVRHYFVEDERSNNRDKFASVTESFHFLERATH